VAAFSTVACGCSGMESTISAPRALTQVCGRLGGNVAGTNPSRVVDWATVKDCRQTAPEYASLGRGRSSIWPAQAGDAGAAASPSQVRGATPGVRAATQVVTIGRELLGRGPRPGWAFVVSAAAPGAASEGRKARVLRVGNPQVHHRHSTETSLWPLFSPDVRMSQ
jgi:hypothetical protein